MERHQRHAPRLLVVLVLLGDERHLLEELGEAPVGRSLFELGRHTAELAEVLDPALGLDGPLRLELEQVAGLGGRRLDHPLRRRARLERLLQALHHADEPRDAPFARAPRSAISSARLVASRNGIRSIAANASSAATVASPMPRLGVFTTRRALITSCGFSSSRRYARTSLTSLRW